MYVAVQEPGEGREAMFEARIHVCNTIHTYTQDYRHHHQLRLRVVLRLDLNQVSTHTHTHKTHTHIESIHTYIHTGSQTPTTTAAGGSAP